MPWRQAARRLTQRVLGSAMVPSGTRVACLPVRISLSLRSLRLAHKSTSKLVLLVLVTRVCQAAFREVRSRRGENIGFRPFFEGFGMDLEVRAAKEEGIHNEPWQNKSCFGVPSPRRGGRRERGKERERDREMLGFCFLSVSNSVSISVATIFAKRNATPWQWYDLLTILWQNSVTERVLRSSKLLLWKIQKTVDLKCNLYLIFSLTGVITSSHLSTVFASQWFLIKVYSFACHF